MVQAKIHVNANIQEARTQCVYVCVCTHVSVFVCGMHVKKTNKKCMHTTHIYRKGGNNGDKYAQTQTISQARTNTKKTLYKHKYVNSCVCARVCIYTCMSGNIYM